MIYNDIKKPIFTLREGVEGYKMAAVGFFCLKYDPAF